VQSDFSAASQHSIDLPPGLALIYVIASLLLLSTLAIAITTLTPIATLTTLSGFAEQRAYYLALSGLNFWSPGKTGTYTIGDGSFTLATSGPDANGCTTVNSVGCSGKGSAAETNVLLSTRRQSLAPITFENNIADFSVPASIDATHGVLVFDKDLPNAPAGMDESDWVLLWGENVGRYASGWMQFGGTNTAIPGIIWYRGNHGACPEGVCPDGQCLAGRCSFGQGLRAYFDFALSGYDASEDSDDYGDGFTFAIINAATNAPDAAVGGPAKGFRNEYLGYAGPGPGGQGLHAPKLAVEVDLFPNTGKGNPKNANCRADASNANHVAVVYWGASDTDLDDNVHGAGSAPANPAGGSSGYVQQARTAGGANWLEDGRDHALRVEIDRTTAAGQGVYRVQVWVDPDGDGAKDVTRDYTEQTPQIDHTARLAQTDHSGLDVVYFGWTEAMSSLTGRSQTAAIHDFALEFRH